MQQSTNQLNHHKIIDTSNNTSIRVTLGAFRSSPIESIQNLAQKPPPELRKIEKSLLYAQALPEIQTTQETSA